jgi:redox-sensitive bicupin YhaK (pirin superfamily)
MITIRKSTDRGHADHGWLDTRHSFSFAGYLDPQHVGFRSLRVINEDFIAPGAGFGTHPHDNMEILTWILEGGLEHKDNMGNGSVIRSGDIQRMTAGTGVTHSEFNASKEERVHLLQIWLLPEEQGLAPSYEEAHIPEEDRRGRLTLIAARNGRDRAITIHQDVELYDALLEAGDAVEHRLAAGRGAWVQVARGRITLNGQKLGAGDAAAVEDEELLSLESLESTEALLFDLA